VSAARRAYVDTVDPDELTDLVFPEPAPDDLGSDVAAHAEPRPVDKLRHSAAGAVIAAGLFGLRDALEGRPEKEEVTIVSEAPTRPVEDGFTLVFDEHDPNSLRVVLPPRRPDDST
jgi:hypothetical protein